MKVGIDPDCIKSGVAIAENGKITELHSLHFADLIQFLQDRKEQISLVVVEAGWLNKSNWHLPKGCSAAKAAKMGEGVGRNQQTGILIVEMLEAIGIPCRLSRPAAVNRWKNSAQIFKQITGWAGQSNPETRDAAMLVFNL